MTKLYIRRFQNIYSHASHNFLGVLRWKLGPATRAAASRVRATPFPIPPEWPASLASESPIGLTPIHATWIGHSTFLIQHGGRNILTDPIFGHCGPFPFGRMRRMQPPGVSFDSLPCIDDVLISHSHYDHLDIHAIRALGNEVRYWVPEGLSGWFRQRGIDNCRELAWWDSAPISESLEVHSVPAQHGSGRTPFDRNRTHWCGWVLRSPDRRVFFAGDTGYSPSFAEIGQRFGAFDLALLPIGAYEPRWLMQPVHMNPAEAVQAHIDLGSRLSIACHWGTFRLTDEPPEEPPALLARESELRQIEPRTFATLRIGERVIV